MAVSGSLKVKQMNENKEYDLFGSSLGSSIPPLFRGFGCPDEKMNGMSYKRVRLEITVLLGTKLIIRERRIH